MISPRSKSVLGRAAAFLIVLVGSYVSATSGFQPASTRTTTTTTTTTRLLDTNFNNHGSSNSDDDDSNNNGFDVNGGFPAANGNPHLPTSRPSSSTSSSSNRPSKADLYSNEELANLLNLHQSIEKKGGFANGNTAAKAQQDGDDDDHIDNSNKDGPIPFGLHDMVLQALDDIETSNESATDLDSENTENQHITNNDYKYSFADDEDMKRILLGIRAVASDVDGTLTASDQSVHPTTKRAVTKAVEAAFSPVRSLRYFFPATGKTRAGALASLGPELQALLSQCPGVFIQGLYSVDAQGNVVYEEKLEQAQADRVVQFAESQGLSVFGYDGDKIMTTSRSNPRHVDEFHSKWCEPTPILMDSLLDYKPRFHKCLLWSDDIQAIGDTFRPQLEQIAQEMGGNVTQAIPTMLEFLPAGASKAKGVRKLCEHLGIDMSSELLAIGDAENDMGFLKESAFGVAVGNAVSKTKQSADFVMKETSDQGAAGLAIELFGLGGALE